MKQLSIAKPVKGVGIGLHKGQPIEIRLEPMEANSGVVFPVFIVHIAIWHQRNTCGCFIVLDLFELPEAFYLYFVNKRRQFEDGKVVEVQDIKFNATCFSDFLDPLAFLSLVERQ